MATTTLDQDSIDGIAEAFIKAQKQSGTNRVPRDLTAPVAQNDQSITKTCSKILRMF